MMVSLSLSSSSTSVAACRFLGRLHRSSPGFHVALCPAVTTRTHNRLLSSSCNHYKNDQNGGGRNDQAFAPVGFAGILLVGSVSTHHRSQLAGRTSNNNPNGRVNMNSPRAPFRFGPSVRWMTTGNTSGVTIPGKGNDSDEMTIADPNDRQDCPICRKFSQGPCGNLFTTWLECTDTHPGMDPEKPNEALHIRKCQDHAGPLSACLTEHRAYYAGDEDSEDGSIYDDVEAQEQLELQEAWLDVISQVEQQHSTIQPFRLNHKPAVEIQPTTRTGMVGFAIDNFIMGYVKDQDGTLLAAGSVDDLWTQWKEGYGLLQFQIQQTPRGDNSDRKGIVKERSVTVYALYMEDDETDVLYSYTLLVPPEV